ncbi:hypothetical protein SAMN05192534_101564 [Alteribacillus persepolensis]|uniref:Adapter protein MecA 1/2 n=1 Tax=Alteribacillus persepolensis TaxID=568899 RepID=A0A1G7ZJ43_9BACI|nr:hypothetical protein [Alteribacillus persepolensis]SDH08635.1 hypothetical protein SAMN05192534_101564 [Alteribacillus persepolensis]
MEMYTWPEDRLQVYLDTQELKRYGLDPRNGLVHRERAEAFFVSLLWMASNHFQVQENAQLDVEFNEGEAGDIFLLVHFYDEHGNQMPLFCETSQNEEVLLFRFATKENLGAFALRAAEYDLKGGTLLYWYPYDYLLFTCSEMTQQYLLTALLEEYGEKTYIDPGCVQKRGKVINVRSALQYLASPE